MQDTVMDKTRLAAFADGELPPEEAAAVVMHLANHPQDQAFVDDLMAANEALLRAFSAPMAEPVPPGTLTTILGAQAASASAQVIAFPARRTWALGGLALAASVALGMVLFSGQQAGGLQVGPVANGTPLHDHLTALASGQTVDFGAATLTILATLPVDAGHCREVEVIDRSAARLDLALACNRGAGWQIDVALAEPLPKGTPSDTFVPATGADAQALTLWLDRYGAGMVLTPDAEAAAIARNWQP